MLRFLLCLLLATAGPALAQPFSFALIGDAPYNRGEAVAFDRMIDAINADRDIALVLHAGDMKSGGEPCSDELLHARIAQLARSTRPLLVTPGDNDWTDCHRARAGRHLPTERLARLRELLYPDRHHSLGARRLPLRSQADAPEWREFTENAMFDFHGVVFASLHVVGSGNGREPWSGLAGPDSRAAPRADRAAEFTRREAAAAAWIATTFRHARETDAGAVVLLMQANPQIEKGAARRAPYAALLAQIEAAAREFGRPVLLAHGDEHEFFFDMPLPGAPQLTRVQSFGSPAVHWVEVRVDPAAAQVFSFRPHYVSAPGQP